MLIRPFSVAALDWPEGAIQPFPAIGLALGSQYRDGLELAQSPDQAWLTGLAERDSRFLIAT